MKVRILARADVRIAPAVVMAFAAGPAVLTIPRWIGKELVARGKAEAVPPRRKAKPEKET